MDINTVPKSNKTNQPANQSLKYSVSEANALKTFFEVNPIQDVIALDNDLTLKIHMHNFYLIVWFFKGKGKYIIDFEEYDVKDGTMFFILPSQLHQFKDITDFSGYVILFSEDFLDAVSSTMHKHMKNEIFSSYKGASVCSVIDEEAVKMVKNRLYMIIEEYTNGKQLYGHEDELAALLSSFLVTIKRHGKWNNHIEVKKHCNDYNNYLNFTNAVETNFKEVHKVKEYTYKLGISIGTLTKSVLNITGQRPLEVIDNRIILEAKRMLHFTLEMNVKQVAGELGFVDPSNFVKFFKRHVGISPNDFRRLY